MIDPVSTELQRRSEEAWPWRRAAAAALLLHAVVAAIAVFAPPARRRPLTLPSVQVRVAALPAPAVPDAASPGTRPAATRAPAPPPSRKIEPKPTELRATKTASSTKRRVQEKPAAPAGGPRSTAALPPDGLAGAAGGVVRSGALAVGPAAAGDADAFPFQYYLSRLLALVEGNWFRPPASPGTSCRIRCRIDRSGALREVGIEQASGSPAFDRAALRALYACSPLPPLPQGYGGNELTLHLEFGP